MQFYVADYLADTRYLTTEEHGAYLLLIFAYWQTGKPLDKKMLARIAGLSNERWTSVEQVLSGYFIDSGDTWVHARIEADMNAVEESQNKKVIAGKASAAARKRNKTADAKRALSERSTPVEQVLNSVPTEGQQNPTIRDTDTDIDTEEKKDGLPASSSPAKPKTGACPHQQIIDLYHEILPTLRGVKIWTDKREKHLQARWREDPKRQNLDWWRDYFRIVAASDFLMGQNDRGFTADLEWLVNQANMTKVLEGKYNARASPQGAAPSATFNQNKANIQAWLDMKKQQREREVSDCD